MSQIADEMTVDYLNNLRALGVDQIDHMPKATEHIAGIIEFTQALIDKGFAYATGGDVFFDVARTPSYGKLSNRRPDEQQGEGGGAASKKRNPGDFALWKAAKPGEPAWDSPWGKGRPGWHIECSAMSKAHPRRDVRHSRRRPRPGLPAPRERTRPKRMLPRQADGQVLAAQRPAAQGEAGGQGRRQERSRAAGRGGGKMSRSAGAGGLADVIAAQGGERIRFFLLRTHYRSTVMFGDEGLGRSRRRRSRRSIASSSASRRSPSSGSSICRQPTTRQAGEFDPGRRAAADRSLTTCGPSFLEKMDDDFNTGGAIAELFDLVRELNKFADQKKLDELRATSKRTTEALTPIRCQVLVQATRPARAVDHPGPVPQHARQARRRRRRGRCRS